eukprot:m.10194 g.10194  ORF g.10194 m.10194 type:complete len:307 (+) comp5152_c1_seq1:82-1002(+)
MHVRGGRERVQAVLLEEGRHDCPQHLVCTRLGGFHIRIHIEQLPHALHGQLVVVVGERGKGVLQHVGCVRHVEQRQHTLVQPVGIVLPLREHTVLHLLDDALLGCGVCDGVCGHVEQEKVLLLRCQHALLHQSLCQALAHVAHVELELERVPGLAAEQLNPVLHTLGCVRRHDVLERLVQEDVAGGAVALCLLYEQLACGQATFPHAVLLQLDAVAQAELNKHAAAQTRGDAVVPEGCVALAVLDAEEKHLLHQRQAGKLCVGILALLIPVLSVGGIGRGLPCLLGGIVPPRECCALSHRVRWINV